jgi:hypothetical protein
MNIRIKMTVIVFLLGMSLFTVAGRADTLDEWYAQAKLYIFDKQWDKALEVLDRLIGEFPEHKYQKPYLFYRAKSLAGLNRLPEALKDLKSYIDHSASPTLKEDAIIEMIEINSRLYKKHGNPEYLNTTLNFLGSKERFVRYYAALELSYIQDKIVARRAVPTLKEIVNREENEELVNRAKLGLMRIDPKFLAETSREPALEDALLKITVYDKAKGKYSMEISIPFALVKMALDSLPENVSREFSEQDIKLDSIMKVIMEKREVFRMETEDSIVKIWLK